MLGRDFFGTVMKIAGAGIVAEACPSLEHIIEMRIGEIPDVGPAGDEVPIVGLDHGYRRLLQHDLR